MSEILDRQIRCVEREIAMRKAVYPGRVQANKMPEARMIEEIETMTEVLGTLRFVKKWEGPIRSAVKLAMDELAPFQGAGLDIDQSKVEIRS